MSKCPNSTSHMNSLSYFPKAPLQNTTLVSPLPQKAVSLLSIYRCIPTPFIASYTQHFQDLEHHRISVSYCLYVLTVQVSLCHHHCTQKCLMSLPPDHLNPSLTPLSSGHQCPNVLTRQLYPTQDSYVLVSSCPDCTGVSLCHHCTGNVLVSSLYRSVLVPLRLGVS